MKGPGKIRSHNRFRFFEEFWPRRSEPSTPRKRILYICHIDWGWIKQRPQHLAEQLEKFCDVTVVFNGNWRRKSLVNKFRVGRRCIPLPRIPLRGRVPFIAMLDLFFTRAIVRVAIWLNRPDYIWLTWPDLYSYLPPKVKSTVVYDCMDNALAFPHEELRAASLETVERALIARADIVFASSERLQTVLQSRYGTQKTFHLLRNAFDGKLLPVMPEKLPDQHAYKIGYCGTIAKWLDWDLLTELVDVFPGVEIHLVGALDGGTSIVRHARIIWHEPVTHDRLPAVMAEFDCLAMPFVVTPLIESVDPVKLYEYINFAKPIISVYYDEIARFAPFVHFYRKHQEALYLFSRLMAGSLGRKYSESERQAFLAENSWSERASVAATLLKTMQMTT